MDKIKNRIITGRWVGVDSAWEQEKLEARKMLVSRAESRQSTSTLCWHALDLGNSLDFQEQGRLAKFAPDSIKNIYYCPKAH